MQSFVAIVAFVAVAQAVPAKSKARTSFTKDTTAPVYSLNQLARFDNDPNGIPLIAAAPINIYDDIFWQGMSLDVTPGAARLTGIIPNSQPNMAAFAVADTSTILQGTPSMTTVYSDSTVSCFDLNSFYFGCGLTTEETAEGIVQSCILTVKGYNPSGKFVSQESFPFTSNGGASQQMIQAKLPSTFKKLQHADFSVKTTGLLSLLGNTTVVGFLDTLDYTVYSSQPISN